MLRISFQSKREVLTQAADRNQEACHTRMTQIPDESVAPHGYTLKDPRE